MSKCEERDEEKSQQEIHCATGNNNTLKKDSLTPNKTPENREKRGK